MLIETLLNFLIKKERERDSLGFPYRKVNVSSSTSIIINYYYYKGIG